MSPSLEGWPAPPLATDRVSSSDAGSCEVNPPEARVG